MKSIHRRLVAASCASVLWAGWGGADTLVIESFETDGEGSRYESNAFVDSASDFFTRHQFSVANPHPAHSDFIGGIDGNWAWASEDIGDPGNPLGDLGPGIVLLDDIDASAHSDLSVTIALAISKDDGTRWETTDEILVQAAFDTDRTNSGNLDGGTYTTIGRFSGTAQVGGNLVESVTGVRVTTVMQDFTFPVSGSGNLLSVRIRVSDTSGSEELIFDNIRVDGTVATSTPPVLSSIEGTPLTYTEEDPVTPITATLSISDSDSTDLESATIRIQVNNQPAEDVLSASGLPSGISAGAYDAASGTLTLSGTGSVADYQTALRAVSYANANTNNPSPVTRTVSFTVRDSSGSGNEETRDITVIPTISTTTLPVDESFETDGEGERYESNAFDASGTSSGFFARSNGSPPEFFDPIGGADGTWFWAADQTGNSANPLNPDDRGFVKIQPIDAAGFSSLQVTVGVAASRIGSARWEADDELLVQYAFDSDFDASLDGGSYTTIGRFAANGLNELVNTASGAEVTTNIEDFVFSIPTSGNTLSVRIVADCDGSEELAFDHIRVTGNLGPANDPPQLSNIEPSPITFLEGDAPTPVTSTLTVADTDDSDLENAVADIVSGFVTSEDRLIFVDQNGITGSYDTGTGALRLTGTATVANYQAALRSVTYQNTNPVNPSAATRTVRFIANDGTAAGNAQRRDIFVEPILAGPASLPFCESFETDGNGIRYAANAHDPAGSSFFDRTDLNPPGDFLHPLTGADSNFFWASENTDNAGNPLGAAADGYVKTQAIDVGGVTNLQVSLLMAVSRAGEGRWEPLEMDGVEVQYAFDGDIGGGSPILGTYATAGRFSPNAGNELAEEISGTPLTSTFTNFTFDIPGSGDLLAIRVVTRNDGSEEVAFDNICVNGTSPEIEVKDGPNSTDPDLDDGTGVDVVFANTAIGFPVTRAFTVLNTGLTGTVLHMDNAVVPAGFSLVGSPFPMGVAAGASASFQVQLDAATDGTFSGRLELATNDLDENPFDFPLLGVVAATQTTTIAINSAIPNPSVVGQTVTVQATVTPAIGGVPTGNVGFFDGGASLGTSSLTGGVASLETTAIPLGSRTLTAVYDGSDPAYAGSTSADHAHQVDPSTTTTTLSDTPDPSLSTETVTLVATVAAGGGGSGSPTGSVTFLDGVTPLGSATITNGSASLQTTAIDVGARTLTAIYDGADASYLGSTSPGESHTVTSQPSCGATVTIRRPAGSTAKVRISVLLAGDLPGPGGGALNFVSAQQPASGQAATLASGDWIFYTADSGFNAPDVFTYTFSELGGGTETCSVNVEIQAISDEASNAVAIEAEGADVRVRFAGIPERTYSIEYSPDTTAPFTWSQIDSQTADSLGQFNTLHTPGSPNGRYRARFP